MYHTVHKMSKSDPAKGARRVVLLISYFAEMFLLGEKNPTNVLPIQESIINP